MSDSTSTYRRRRRRGGSSGSGSRSQGSSSSRSNSSGRASSSAPRASQPPKKKTLFERIKSFFTGGDQPPASSARSSQPSQNRSENRSQGASTVERRTRHAGGQSQGQRREGSRDGSRDSQSRDRGPRPERRERRGTELREVTSSRLYVGNLSYDATEEDLTELFKGVGTVESAEVVTHSRTQRSKGFAFVEMSALDQAQRAAAQLHDSEFMGRKLVVTGAKPAGSYETAPSASSEPSAATAE